MGWGSPAPVGGLVGRVDEQDKLKQALGYAAAGDPCALVITGEAGVGKTRLVREVLATVDAEVLWGACVHFGASSLPFAPLVTALRTWLLQAQAHRRAEVLAGSPDLERLLPGFLGAAAPPGRLIPLLDAALTRLAERRLTVLVIDDLHWADVSSLDALAYVIAGFRGQRMAVIATCREENRPEGHPLHGWLADMRRMPSFVELRLGRLDLPETEALASRLLGQRIDLDLASQIRSRSGGNPYLTELLVRGLDGPVRELPAAAPTELRDALTARWHALGAEAREVVKVLAVGGRPQRFEVLAEVAQAAGLSRNSVSPALAEAIAEGVVREDRGRFWFRHPLLAEVLYDGMTSGEPARLHAVYARVLDTEGGEDEGRLAADLAVHHERAGNLDEAFTWSLRAADHAAHLHASAEEATHLERACRLWPEVPDPDPAAELERVDLLFRTSQASSRVSRYEDALRLLEEARAMVDQGQHPLLASKLLTSWCQAAWQRSAPGTSRRPEHDEALRLTDGHPDSVERVQALAAMAGAEGWDGNFEAARAHAEAALELARRTGSDLALARALNTWVSLQPEPGQEVMAAIEEALALARAAGDVDEIVDGVIWLMNVLQCRLRIAEAAEAGQQAFAEVLRLGDPHWGYFVAAMSAADLMTLGRWDEARDLLREALAVRSVGIPGALTRFVAAQLAVGTGDLAAARQHLDRALELVDPDFGGLHYNLVGTVTEVLLAEGRAEEALAWVRDRLTVRGALDPRVEAPDLVWLARVNAELLQQAHDSGDAPAVAKLLGELDSWVAEFTVLLPGLGLPEDRLEQVEYLEADAEVARCRRDADEPERWERVIRQCRSGGLRWDETTALLRWCEAAVRLHRPRDELGPRLRRLHRLLVGMGAAPMREQAEFLARSARVSLKEPVTIPAQGPATQREGPLAELTGRERQILGHLVAGRTNTEIARTLVISDKTVSVHVSNILRKTGTTSRTEAAALARRARGPSPG